MTIEATFILPFFLFVFLNLISIIEVYRLYANLKISLWNSGRILAQYGYLIENETKDSSIQDKIGSITFSEVYVKNNLKKDLSNSPSAYLVLKNGPSEISCLGSSIMETDENLIKLKANYKVTPLFGFVPGLRIDQQVTYYGHAWTGYSIDPKEVISSQNDEYVYIAENGTVYHCDSKCSYINPQIMETSRNEINEMRNYNGEKYEKCPICKPDEKNINLYITKYGDVYHASTQCYTLKRTVYRIKLSEVGDRAPCSKCGR